MTTALWCVLIAGLLPYGATLTAKIGGAKFDNANPRDWLGGQSGFRRRANAAQLNSFEAFPLFAAAVIVAQMLGARQGRVDMLALVFVAEVCVGRIVAVVGVQDRAGPFLAHPRLAGPIEKPGCMHRCLVAMIDWELFKALARCIKTSRG